jgi:hypothetical protein
MQQFNYQNFQAALHRLPLDGKGKAGVIFMEDGIQ